MTKTPLNTVCDIRNGYAFKSTEFQTTGTPLIRISNFENGPVTIDDKTIYVNTDYLKTKSSFIVEKGDVLIALSGATTGKYGIYTKDEPSLLNQRIGLLKSGSSMELDDKFFYHYLSILQGEIFRKAAGAAQPNISTKAIGSMEIPLPPLETQKKIAEILDTADAYRQKTKELIAKYDELAQSLFLDMFGDPVRNEKSLAIVPLKSFIRALNTGVSVNSTDETFSSEKIGVLKTSCVYTGRFRPQEAKVVREDEYNRMKLNPTSDSIIISRMNTTELVGMSAFIDKEYRNLYLPDRLWQTEKGEVNHNVYWLSKAISTKSFMSKISQISSGTSGSMKNISKKNFLSLSIINPSIEFQNLYAKKLSSIESQRDIAVDSLDKAEDLFNSLLQKAFKGELV